MEEDIVHTVTDALAPKAISCNGKVLEHCPRVKLYSALPVILCAV